MSARATEVSFSSNKADNPAKFYLLSAPAHHAYPTKLLTIANAKRLDLGSQETSNERSIFQFTTTIGDLPARRRHDAARQRFRLEHHACPCA
jgi:5-keto 4-deoxyuronate isomerase